MFHYNGEMLLEEIDPMPNESFFDAVMKIAMREKDNVRLHLLSILLSVQSSDYC